MGYEDDKLTEAIIKCVIKVHQTLGPGFLESIYRHALLIELRKNDLPAETEKTVRITYDGKEIGSHRLDILVLDTVVVELKTVEELARAHFEQVRSYLKAAGLRVGLLVNFAKEKAEYRRIEQ